MALTKPSENMLNQSLSSAKAWVTWDQSATLTILDSFNVTSVTDDGVGDATINFTNAMANANYSYAGMAGNGAATGIGFVSVRGATSSTDPSTTALPVLIATAAGASTDFEFVSVIVFGDQ